MIQNHLKVLEVPMKILNFFKLWVDKSSPKYHKVFAIVMHLIFVELFLLLQMIRLTQAKNIEEFSLQSAMFPANLSASLRALNFVLKRNKIKAFMKSLNNLLEDKDWLEIQNGEKLKQRTSQANRVFKVFVAFYAFGMIFATFGTATFPVYDLPIAIFFPFDPSYSMVPFYFGLAYELFAILIYSPVSTVFEALPLYFMSFVSGIIEEFSEKLRNFGHENVGLVSCAATSFGAIHKQDDQNLRQLEKYIKVHLKIKALHANINDTFGLVLLAQALISILSICTASFSLVQVVRIKILR